MNESSGERYPIPLFFIILVLCLVTYTLLHAAGHTFIAFLGGADIRDQAFFSVPPFVSYESQVSGVFAHFVGLAGPIFPVIVAIISMILIPKTRNVVLEASKTIFCGLIIFSLGGNIISLILHSFGRNSDADTMAFFSKNPGANPMLVALACLFLITVILILIGKKANYKLIPGLYALLKQDGSTISNRKKKVVLTLMVLISFGLAGAILFSPGPPPDLLRRDLSKFSAREMILYRFDIKQDSMTFEYNIKRLKAEEFELSIKTDASKIILLSVKGKINDIDHRKFVLHKGIHFLMASNRNCHGILTMNKAESH